MQIYLAQLAPKLGDVLHNCKQISQHYLSAEQHNCQFLLLPEMAVTGYNPGDLLLKPSFIAQVADSLKFMQGITKNCVLLLPTPLMADGKLYNSVLAMQHGKIIGRTDKVCLPNYGIFNEQRYFTPGTAQLITAHNIKVAVPICEDIWQGEIIQGAEVILSPNASPWQHGKMLQRATIAKEISQNHQVPFFYCNQAISIDGIVYDGQSFAYHNGLQYLSPAFVEDHAIIECSNQQLKIVQGKTADIPNWHDREVQLDFTYSSLVKGIRDYVLGNGFSGAVIGLSGGVDSALTLALAVDALGASQITSMMLPSKFSTQESMLDASEIIELLRCRNFNYSIEPIVKAYHQVLPPLFPLAQENLQSRVRAVMLMAMANQRNLLLLNTSNKSEAACGYSTIYGDTCGALAPLQDLYKTEVWELAAWRNQHIPSFTTVCNPHIPVMPSRVISKPPSAELRYGQLDTDTLPEYNTLDSILRLYLEDDLAEEEIAAQGFRSSMVQQIIKMVENSEYKRRQAPPGIKLSSCYLRLERVYPITMKTILTEKK